MNVFLNKTEHLQKTFDVMFISFSCNPDKVAFERITLITAVTGKTAISPALTAPPAGRELMCIRKFVETLASVCKHKQKHASELF